LLFSSHVHGLPMSFYRMGGDNPERGRGLPSRVEEGYTSLCLSLAAKVLVSTRDDVHQLFAGMAKKVEAAAAGSPDDLDAISEHLPVGGAVDVVDTATLRIAMLRKSDSEIEVCYYYPPTNELVLRRKLCDSEGSSLTWLDLAFWNVAVNGHAATEKMLTNVLSGRMSFKVDTDARSLSFKSDGEPASSDTEGDPGDERGLDHIE
jgi:hypothetical protein